MPDEYSTTFSGSVPGAVSGSVTVGPGGASLSAQPTVTSRQASTGGAGAATNLTGMNTGGMNTGGMNTTTTTTVYTAGGTAGAVSASGGGATRMSSLTRGVGGQHGGNTGMVVTTSGGMTASGGMFGGVSGGGAMSTNYLNASSGGAAGMMTTGGGSVFGGVSEQHEERGVRTVSTVVIESQMMGEAPADTERVVELPPVYEEHVSYVTRKEVQEIEKRVMTPVVEYVDVVRERAPPPVEEIVEVTHYYDVPAAKRAPRVVQRTVDNVIEKKVPTPRRLVQEVEVPEYVTREEEELIERRVEVSHFVDEDVPVVVAQTIKPVILSGHGEVEVPVTDYEPEVIPVNVHVARPIASTLEASGSLDSKHRLVNVAPAQYNAILRSLNSHLQGTQQLQQLPYITEGARAVEFATDQQANQFILAPANIEIEGYNAPREVSPSRPYSTATAAAAAAVTALGTGPGMSTAQMRAYGGSETQLRYNAEHVDKRRMICCNGGGGGAPSETASHPAVLSPTGHHHQPNYQPNYQQNYQPNYQQNYPASSQEFVATSPQTYPSSQLLALPPNSGNNLSTTHHASTHQSTTQTHTQQGLTRQQVVVTSRSHVSSRKSNGRKSSTTSSTTSISSSAKIETVGSINGRRNRVCC